MSDLLPSLDAIGIAAGTDKSSSDHGYLAFYERFFQGLRNDKIRVLEIGVLNGSSLRTWETYFPNALIVGADLDARVKQYESERVKIQILDQSNVQDLINLGIKYGPFDIIIEDGSHMWEHQITTLKTLFPFLKNHGYYIVEDLQTNYGGMTEAYRGNSSITCVDYLKKLVDLRVGDEQIDITVEEDPFLRTFGRSVAFVAFCRHACLLQKDYVELKRSADQLLQTPLIETEADARSKEFRMLAHVGVFGDIENQSAMFVNAGSMPNVFIQGFALNVGKGLRNEIKYRARLQSGDWTAWVSGDSFVGTRGLSQSLTGFSVAILGTLSSAYDLIAVGLFAGDKIPVAAEQGADCVSLQGKLPLRGMQLVLRPKRDFVP